MNLPETNLPKLLGQPARTTLQMSRVLRMSAYGGEANKIYEL
jgi:hypothetical protein